MDCYSSYGVTGKSGKGSSRCMLHEREMFHSGDNYCAFHQCLGQLLGHSHSQDGKVYWEPDSFFFFFPTRFCLSCVYKSPLVERCNTLPPFLPSCSNGEHVEIVGNFSFAEGCKVHCSVGGAGLSPLVTVVNLQPLLASTCGNF